MRLSRKKGFTLVELMISVSILIMLVGILTVIFKATQESFSQASTMQRVFDTSRNVMQRMHDEISAAFFGPLGRTGLLGLDASETPIKTDSQGDSLFFFIPLTELDETDVVEVGYWLHLDGNLMRHYEENSDYDFNTASIDDPLGLIIQNLEFTYYNGESFQDTWDSRMGGAEEGKAPKAVKVAFSVSDPKGLMTRTFETMVHITSGRRY